MRRVAPAALLTMLGAVAAAGCRHHAATAPARASSIESYCWWTVRRTALPPDSVAERFRRGFATVGLGGASSSRRADTVWVQAGPTALGGGPAGAAYAMWTVAFPVGDSTHFRSYVAAAAPPGGWAQPADTGEAGRRFIPMCGDVARAAGVPSTSMRDPGAEESLSVWRRAP